MPSVPWNPLRWLSSLSFTPHVDACVQESLAEKCSSMEKFLDSFPMGYIHVRADNTVTVNSAYEEVTGYTKDDFKDPAAVALAMHGSWEM